MAVMEPGLVLALVVAIVDSGDLLKAHAAQALK